MNWIRHLPNGITFFRIIVTVFLLVMKPFSMSFWILYTSAGVSDIADGFLARKMHLESESGAKLDSAADLLFFIVVIFVMIKNITIPQWVWIAAGVIAGFRLTAYLIGFLKYHSFSALHTWLNKLTGMLLFVLPALMAFLNKRALLFLICLIAFFSSAEELYITVKSSELKRDCRGLFDI